jgi:3-deoxy-D-manno-octulosonic-acid transferase
MDFSGSVGRSRIILPVGVGARLEGGFRPVLMWLLYQIATALALLVGAPFFLILRGRHYLATLPGRLGRYHGPVPERPLWIHAVSVGEVGVAAALAEALPADLPLLVTTITPTGQRRAQAIFGERAAVTYLPFELGFAVDRFMRRFQPRALVLCEGDLWPLVLRRAKRDGLPSAVVNGRVSDRGFRRMRRVQPLLGALLGRVDHFSMQSAEDRQRLLDLGVAHERTSVTGNLKYESPEPATHPELERRLGELAGGRPMLLAGSTMSGEEAQVVEAFERLGGGERAMLLIAPRHPERWPEVARWLSQRGLDAVQRSELPANGRPAVVLLDSLGELAGLYRIATAAFVGGTLTPTGGHNPLEPARYGVPVAVGPSMENFREMAAAFDASEAWARVRDAEGLAQAWDSWLDEPDVAAAVGERGAALIEANRGALARTVADLEPILSSGASPR